MRISPDQMSTYKRQKFFFPHADVYREICFQFKVNCEVAFASCPGVDSSDINLKHVALAFLEADY